MTQAEQHLRKASDAFLLKDYDNGLAALIKAQAHLEMVKAWIYRES